MQLGNLDLLGWMTGQPGLLAYLDPGTGSYALQLLLAGLFGGLFALKQSWSDLKTWYAARSRPRPEPGD